VSWGISIPGPDGDVHLEAAALQRNMIFTLGGWVMECNMDLMI